VVGTVAFCQSTHVAWASGSRSRSAWSGFHGGDVTVESKGRGAGASFTVRLPAIEAPEPLPRDSVPTLSRRAETILVVEDNADARESLCIALELQGHRVLGASDGSAALDIVRRERPRVAVLDIGLPGMDGHELARRVRAESGG
jgi:hypothetical protein